MKKYRVGLILASAFSLLFIARGLVFSQETTGESAKGEDSAAQASAEAELITGAEWLWGDVVAVDAEKKEIKIKHLDYETYTEKEIGITVDNNTTYENVKTLDQIKTDDTVSVDYIVDAEGKNVAKNISVEKLEATESEVEGGTVQDVQDVSGAATATQDLKTEEKTTE